MTIDEIVEQLGEYVNVQLSYTYTTRDAIEQFLDNSTDKDSSSTDVPLAEVLEHLLSSTSHDIARIIEEDGRISLERDLIVTDEFGSPVEEY
jgi:hypothetical protein